MSDISRVELADLTTAVARTLATICRHLIDKGALDEELLIADLAAVRAGLISEGVGLVGVVLPAALAAALHQGPEKQP